LNAHLIFDLVKAKAPSDLKPTIAEMSYELHKKRRHDSHAIQDWKKAEREIGKSETKK